MAEQGVMTGKPLIESNRWRAQPSMIRRVITFTAVDGDGTTGGRIEMSRAEVTEQ
jgi:hypothetical protein